MEFSLKHLRFSFFWEVWAFTFFIFLNQIIDQINWSVDKFLLGRMVGTVTVAVYGVGGQINALYMHMSSAISSVFAPKVNRIVATTNDNRELTELMIKVGRIQFYIVALVLSGLVFFGKPFIRLWAGVEYADAYWVALLLMGPAMIPMIQSIGIEIQRAKNMHRARSIVYTCLAIGNVLLSVVLIRCWGCIGAAAGTAISMVLGTGLFMNWYYHKKIGLDMCSFWLEIVKNFPALVIMCMFGTAWCSVVTIRTWGGLLFSIGVYSVAYMWVMWRFAFNASEKHMIKIIAIRARNAITHCIDIN
jgi:O-antigen/teichoic acid export membrane protein